ncbi:HNH endonuclease [Paraburkholderia sp.]|uniref:HNH endonuclease n=1 Tax=Paraburkholderia sp. TaxID=1926495 RepID=UPI0039C97F9D
MCSTCQEPITKATPWDVRHIVKRAEGGSDAAGNLQMHHLNCRRNHYSAGNTVVKPGDERCLCRGLSRVDRKTHARF